MTRVFTLQTSFLLFIILLSLFSLSFAGKGKKYNLHEDIPLLVNTIGPHANPSVTFEYYSFPFCSPDNIKAVKIPQTIGQKIEGDKLYASLFEHKFGVPISKEELCNKYLSNDDVDQLKKAIKDEYSFEFWIDGLPLRDFIGIYNNEEYETYELYTHINFHFLFNENRIISVNIISDTNSLIKLDKEFNIRFTYSSIWEKTDYTIRDRVNLQRDHPQRMEVHWLSIMNSVGLVLLLTGFISIVINRIIKRDITRYSKSLEDGVDDDEEYGWKLIHGEVFRFPEHKNLLSALLGVGIQLFIVCFLLLVLSTIGILYPEQIGSLYSTAIFAFALASCFAGAVSTGFYTKLEGEHWARNIILTATVFAFPAAFISIIADIIARYYHSTSALPIGAAIEIFSIWLFIGLPLTVLGGIAGRRIVGPFSAPVRTKLVPREIPLIPIYRQAPIHYLLGGFLPFSAIYIELHYIYDTLWGHSLYGLYGILFLVFLILVLVTICITITLTYFQLSSEDYNWWWRSFISGGFASIYVLGYSIYYFLVLSPMNGLLQTVKYFSFVLISCYFFFVMLGAIGFYSSLLFIRYIYSTLKID